jgi:hypothetical protein
VSNTANARKIVEVNKYNRLRSEKAGDITEDLKLAESVKKSEGISSIE